MASSDEVLPCKLVVQLAFKAGGDIFHEIVTIKPETLIIVSPAKYQACEIQPGDSAGTDGCVVRWKYTIDGKEQIAETMIQNVDMEKKTITYKWVGGDLLDLYKDIIVTVHVETKQGVDFVTWAIEYELLKPDNLHPLSLINFYIELTTEIETHILG